MVSLKLFLLWLAVIFFLLGAVQVPARVNWVALGLFCWMLTLVLAV